MLYFFSGVEVHQKRCSRMAERESAAHALSRVASPRTRVSNKQRWDRSRARSAARRTGTCAHVAIRSCSPLGLLKMDGWQAGRPRRRAAPARAWAVVSVGRGTGGAPRGCQCSTRPPPGSTISTWRPGWPRGPGRRARWWPRCRPRRCYSFGNQYPIGARGAPQRQIHAHQKYRLL